MKKNVLIQKVVAGVAALLLVAAVPVQAASSAQPLVSTGWVEKNLDRIKNLNQDEIRLIEVSNKGYDQGHIPGAVHMQWGSEIFNPNTDHMVLSHVQLERIMAGKAAPPEAHIVLYDGDGNHHHVTRVYWTLKYWNYDNVSIMDGGKALWQRQERSLSAKPVAVDPMDVKVEYPPNTSIRAMYSPDITHALATGNAVMVDSRTEDFYEGAVYSLNKWVRNGHITGAVNMPTLRAMNGDNSYKDREQLAALYRQAGIKPDDNVIPYCDTGVLGAHAWFVLHELLGYQNVKVYDGSMREYANRFDTPMEPGKVADGFPALPCGCN